MQAIAKIDVKADPRIGKTHEFPMTIKMLSIVDRWRAADPALDISLQVHHGNLVVLGAMSDKSAEEIQRSPVTFCAHLDEITYFVTSERLDGAAGAMPVKVVPVFSDNIKSVDEPSLYDNRVRVFGFRGTTPEDRSFEEIGHGKLTVKRNDDYKNPWDKDPKHIFHLECNEPVLAGDMVIQDHPIVWKGSGLDAYVTAKALDDRFGSVACLYAVRDLAARGIPAKAIFNGDEEGVPDETSWSRLILPTFKKYAHTNNTILISDGIDGSKLPEALAQRQVTPKEPSPVRDALIIPFTSDAKGGGSLGIFAVMRDIVFPEATRQGLEVSLLTSYVSRSCDPKLMDHYPHIGFVDWSNGAASNKTQPCHVRERASLAQLVNIIGTLRIAHQVFTGY